MDEHQAEMERERMSEDMRAYMSSIGSRGGKSKSDAKTKASRANAEKARAAINKTNK